ncbi:MAG: hypothetical protein ACLP9D_14490 [Candidatus Bathyarchaeia archaeon]
MMPSVLVQYNGDKVETKNFKEPLRGVGWTRNGSSLIVVGDGGRIIELRGEELVRFNPNTKHDLRDLSVNPSDDTVLIVGNAGTILLGKDGSFTKLNSPSFENLRAVAWNHKGTMALIAGNNGTLMKYVDRQIEIVDNGRANLRGISWRTTSGGALLTSNCFAEEFIPSPNLFTYDAKSKGVRSVSEGRSDLIGVDWRPDEAYALVVGYDVVWHTGLIGKFDGKTLLPIKFENKRVYPVAVRWDSEGKTAAIVTATAQAGSGDGQMFLWDGQIFKRIYSSTEFFFSHVSWAWKSVKLAGIASTETRAFNC